MSLSAATAVQFQRFASHMMLGMRLDYVDWPDGVDHILTKAMTGESAYCCVPDASQCVRCYDEPTHRAIVNGADLVLSDSMILQVVRGLLHKVRPSKTIKGAEIMSELCQRAAVRRIPIALIGGRDDETLTSLKRALTANYPTLDVVLAFSPPFRPLTEQEDADLVSRVNASGAKLVFVGLGCPKQERWMAQQKGRVHAMMVGVGAAFDFISGAVTPSPAWIHKSGLEWAYRLAKEPKRLWRRYLITAPRFLFLVLREGLSRRYLAKDSPI